MGTRMRWRVALGTPLGIGAAYKGVDVMLASKASANGLPPEPFWFAAVLILAVTWWPYLRRLRTSGSWPFLFLASGTWLALSTRHPTLCEAYDRGLDFLLARIHRATLSTTSSEPVNFQLSTEWRNPSGESEQGVALNENGAGVFTVSDESPTQLKDLRYYLPKYKWDNLLSGGGNLDVLTVSLVATDTRTGRAKRWELGSATRDSKREFPVAPLDLRIETGRAYIVEVERDNYQYAVVVDNCVLTNCTDERMNLSGSLIIEYEGGWRKETELLEGVRNTPKAPFTVRDDSWAGDLAFGFLPRIPEGELTVIGNDQVRATVHFRDSRTRHRSATKKIAFRLPEPLRPSGDDT